MARMLLLSAMTDSTHDPHNPFGGLDLLSSSVVLLDEDLRIRYMNSAAENLLALSSKAVRGMLPRNTLGRAMLKKLKIYAGAEHPHAAQNPAPLELQY